MDGETLAAARLGQPWALRHVHSWLAAPVATYCRRYGSADWEELANDVMLAVLTALPTFEGGPDRVRSYAFTVAHHKVVDDLRRRGRTAPTVTWDAADDVRLVPSAEDVAVRATSAEDVQRLLERLVPDQRDVLLLRIVGDLTVEQVADTLGKSTGAVKQLQRRGLDALRRSFEGAVPL